jgi:hypothetical protein
MALVTSGQFTKLMVMHADRVGRGGGMAVRDLVRMLTFDLPSVPSEFVNSIRRIDFARRSDGHVEVQRGKESLGKSVEAVVNNIDAIQPVLSVPIPVYDAFPACYTVKLGVDVDVDTQTITIAPIGHALDEAKRSADKAIGEFLAKELKDVPIFYGSPWSCESAGAG